MKKHSRIGIIGAAAMAFASAIAPTVAQSSNTNQQQQANTNQANQRDAVSIKVQAPKPVEQRRILAGLGNESNAGRVLNQRQYRKWLKQVPQMRRSKKCRV